MMRQLFLPEDAHLPVRRRLLEVAGIDSVPIRIKLKGQSVDSFLAWHRMS